MISGGILKRFRLKIFATLAVCAALILLRNTLGKSPYGLLSFGVIGGAQAVEAMQGDAARKADQSSDVTDRFSLSRLKLALQPATDGFDRIPLPVQDIASLDAALHWVSIAVSSPHPSDSGQVWLSLVPAGRSRAVIWNVTTDEIVPINPPPGRIGNIVHIGGFHGGLAPAQIQYDDDKVEASVGAGRGKRTAAPRWGYIDTTGNWAIPPRFFDAGEFVGDISVVEVANKSFELIDRHGGVVGWIPGLDKNGMRNTGVGGINLSKVGRWVWVDNQPHSTRSEGVQQEWEWTQLFDGKKLIKIPGLEAIPAVDGELWLVRTNEGRRLWAPSSGFVNLADGIVPQRPLNARLFLANSTTGRSSALYSVTGEIIADPAPVVMALSSNRFIACESGVSKSLHDSRDLGRTLGPDLPGHKCGILDEKGNWWAPPVFQMIDSWGSHDVRLQVGENACVVDLRLPSAPDCRKPIGSSQDRLVSILRIAGIPRLYGFQDSWRKLTLPFQYLQASTFTKNVAEVTDAGGFPGLIDRQGRWLTPRPNSGFLPSALMRATIAQSPYRNKRPTGTGLIDRTGRWVIRPTFRSISRYADGTLLACPHTLGYVGANCQRVAIDGTELPPVSDQTLEAIAAIKGESEGAKVGPDQGMGDPGRVKLVAVAVNGLWGFQSEAGQWVIDPKFDDAEDFVDDLAPVGVQQDQSQVESELPQALVELGGRSVEIRWGLIDPQAHWVVVPSFESIAPFTRGVAVAKSKGLFGLIDTRGKWLAEPEFESIGEFTETFALATYPDGRRCILGRDGHCTTSADARIVAMSGDAYLVAQKTNGSGKDLFGFLDRNGGWVIPPRYIHASPFVGDYAVVTDSLQALSESSREQWVTVEVKKLLDSGLYAIRAERPYALDASAGRFALVDGLGRLLVPSESKILKFFSTWGSE